MEVRSILQLSWLLINDSETIIRLYLISLYIWINMLWSVPFSTFLCVLLSCICDEGKTLFQNRKDILIILLYRWKML